MSNTYKFGNGTWATKKGSTLAYSDTNNAFKPLPFSFERNSIGTRVNKEGLIEVVGNDIPRIDFSNDAKGALLLEPTRSNLVTYSEDFSNWFKIGTATITSNYGVSPDGTQNSSRLQMNASDKIYINVASSGNISFTVYLKGVGQIRLRDNTSTGLKDVTLTNEWVRYELNFNATISNFQIEQQTGVSDFEIYGAQLEESSYATSYIPTNGSIIQRAAETCNGSGNSEVFNDSQGVLFANISALSDNGTNRFISLTDGSNDNRVLFGYRASSNQVFARIEGNNSASVDLTNVVSDTEIVIKLAIYYDSSFNYKMYLNGFLVDNAIGTDSIIGLDTFDFTNATGTENFYGKTKEIAYYDEILTDEELEYMTSYRSLNEMVTELNLNAL